MALWDVQPIVTMLVEVRLPSTLVLSIRFFRILFAFLSLPRFVFSLISK